MVYVVRMVSAAAALVLAAGGTAHAAATLTTAATPAGAAATPATVAKAATPATAAATADLPPTRADIAADALRKDPVHLSPHLEPGAVGPQDIARIRTAARELKAAGIPVYVSVSPVWVGDGSGRFGVAYLALLHDRLRENGAYVHVDQTGRTRIRAYGIEPKGDAESVENRMRGWSNDENASLGDIAVVALNGLRTGEVPRGQGEINDDMAYREPEYRAEKAELVVGIVGAVLVALLGLLHRFTDLPLWPRRGRAPADDVPDVDWRSAPELPDHAYGTLFDLAVRRGDALNAALWAASSAGLPVDSSLAETAADLADDLVICSIPPDFETEQPEGRRVVETIDLPDIVASIEISRIGILALAAMRDGVPLVLHPPCFYNPLHERGAEHIPYPGEDDDPADVSICPACAAHGPDPLLVWDDDGMVPYYESGYTNTVWQATGYGAATLDWDAELLLHVLGTWADEDDDTDADADADADADEDADTDTDTDTEVQA